MRQSFYFIASIVVYYTNKGANKNLPLNVLLSSESGVINRKKLENAQQNAQVRFLQTPLAKDSTITDVYIAAISPLGPMTLAQFHEGFPEGDQIGHNEQAEANDAESGE